MPQTTNPSAPLYGDYRDFSKGGRYGPTGENAPVQTGVENGRNQFDYWEVDPDKVNAYLQANADDPKIREAASRGDRALDAELHSRGIRVPEHYKAGVGPDGQVVVKEMSWWDKQKNWALPALGVGAAIAAPYALGALGGGGGAAGGAGAGAGGSSLTAAPLVGGAYTGGATAATATGATLGGGGGWGALAGAAGKYAKPIAGALNAASQSMAANRGNRLAASQFSDQVASNRQAENRAERDDTWKKLQQASYVQNRSTTPQFAHLSPYASQSRRPTSPEELQGAAGLSREALLRLTQGPQIRPLTDVDEMSQSSKWEKLLGYGGLAASIFSGR